MAYFLSGKGAVIHTKGSGSCAYKVQGWPGRRRIGAGLITIDNIEVTEQDIATPIVAVDNYRAIYRFGQGFGRINIQGTLYFGCHSSAASSVVGRVTSAFNQLRLASKKKPVNVSIASGYKCKAYLISMSFGQADQQFDKVTYVISGLVAPKSR